METATSSSESTTEEGLTVAGPASTAAAPGNGASSTGASNGSATGSANGSTPASGDTGSDATSAAADSAAGDSAPAEESAAPKRGRPRKQSTARKTRTVELTLTVTGTAEGDWQAELVHGGKRVVQGLGVSAAAVSRAAKELHPEISDGIETVITAAREQHQARMQELEAELNKVKQALAELED